MRTQNDIPSPTTTRSEQALNDLETMLNQRIDTTRQIQQQQKADARDSQNGITNGDSIPRSRRS